MRPYEGNEKYIFVSYAHKNSAVVQPVMQAMIHHGFRLWYDSGIEAGTEWPEYIADHLSRCDAVIVFMTNDVVASKNCRNEINYALDLDKPILVVYLEPVTLTKGLALQLNSTQSMYKYLQPSDAVFLQELFRAKMLRNCSGNIESNEAQQQSQPHTSTLITNICSIGSNDFSNPFPTGQYSTIINRDVHQVIYFHANLAKAIGNIPTAKIQIKIYNSDKLLVLDNEIEVACQSNYSRFSTSWVIRGNDGTFVPIGNYYAEMSVNHSPVFTYRFSIIAPSEGVHSPKDISHKQGDDIFTAIDDSLEKRRQKCFNQLSRKKGAIWFVCLLLSVIAFVVTLTNEVPFGALICMILIVICWVGLLKYTKAHIHKSTILALFLITFGLLFYGIFLLIAGVISLCKDKQIRNELAQLSSFRG